MDKVLDSLPPEAAAIFAIALAILFAVRYFGFKIGVDTPPQKSEASAQVAAVIVDNAALKAATASVEALNMTLIERNMIEKKRTETERELVEELERLREEIRIQKEIERRR